MCYDVVLCEISVFTVKIKSVYYEVSYIVNYWTVKISPIICYLSVVRTNSYVMKKSEVAFLSLAGSSVLWGFFFFLFFNASMKGRKVGFYPYNTCDINLSARYLHLTNVLEFYNNILCYFNYCY